MAPRSSKGFCSPSSKAISLPPASMERIGKAGEPNVSRPAASTGLITTTKPPRSQLIHQPRVVGGGVGAHQHCAIGLLQALEVHHRGAAAELPGQADGGRGVAEVGAIGQVVGAQRTQQQLHQEGGPIGGATGAVGGPAGGIGAAEGVGREGVHLVPADRRVVGAAIAADQRPIEAAKAVAVGGVELLEIGMAAAGEHLGRQGGLQLGADQLHALDAALQRLAQLIAEAAVLAAGAPGAGEGRRFCG